MPSDPPISSAFRTWFNDTGPDGSPAQPIALAEKYDVQHDVLGRGSFALVRRVILRATGEERAMKVIAKRPLNDKNERMLMDEIRILQSVCHPHIIQLFDIYETSETVFLVTDYCRGGELFDRLVEKVHYAELDARHITRQIFGALAYLHDHGIIHRDIKPENILLRSHKEPSDIAVSDFGLSRFIPGDGLLLTACGSPQYVAPEVLLGAGYGPEVDVWSAGVVTYCLLAGYTPFYADDQPGLFRQIVAMNYEFEPEYWSGISETAKDFIRRCLCQSSKRMTPHEALIHPWLRDLPPLTSSIDQRGCLLHDCKKRHAKARQDPKAGVSASDIVEYVRNLCTLRSQHPELASSAGIQKLKGMADLICRHQHGDALNESEQRKLNDFVAEAKQRVADHDARVPNMDKGDDQDEQLEEHAQGFERNGHHTHENDDNSGPPAARVFSAPGEPAKQSDIGSKDTFAPSPIQTDKSTEQTLAGSPPEQEGRQVKRQRQIASDSPDAQSPVSKLSSQPGPNDLTVMMVSVPPLNLPDRPPVTTCGARPLQTIPSESEPDLTSHSTPLAAEQPKTLSEKEVVVTNLDRSDSDRVTKPKPKESHRSSSKISETAAKELNDILAKYSKPELPKDARVDPTVPTRSRNPWTFQTAWSLARAVGVFYSSIGRHIIKGPPKASWGIEMTLFTRMLREANKLSNLVSVDTLQKAFALGSLLPIARDGLVTPVTIKVRKLGLKGFLAEADAAETGNRILQAEWVVTKGTWKRLQAEHMQRKSKAKSQGTEPSSSKSERVIYYIHGGAYFVMSPATHRTFTIPISRYSDCRLFAIDYRLAPGTVFPGALHDVVIGYFRLVNDLKVPPQNIVLGSDSAGGGLSLALMMYLRDNGYPLPGGAILFSPWVDLTMSCRSWDDNAQFDYLPRPESGDHLDPVRAYLGDRMDKYLTHPYASPLFGDLSGLPPLLIQGGDSEVLRDEIILLAHKCQQQGVKRRFELYKDCVHVFPAFLFLDASKQALLSARHFVRTALDGRGTGGLPRARVSDTVRGRLNSEQGTNMVPVNDRLAHLGPSSTGPELDADKAPDSDADQADDEQNDGEQWTLGGPSTQSSAESLQQPSLDEAGEMSEASESKASAVPLHQRRRMVHSMPGSPLRFKTTNPMDEADSKTLVTAPPTPRASGNLPRPQAGSWTSKSSQGSVLRARLRARSDSHVKKPHLDALQAMMDGPGGQTAYWDPSTPRSEDGQ